MFSVGFVEPGEPNLAGEWPIEPSGRIAKPLLMGPGATVTGRVVRDGKPVPSVAMVATWLTPFFQIAK